MKDDYDTDQEIERMKAIGQYLDSLPSDQRTAALAFHYQLELKRLELTDEQFLDYLLEQIDFNTRKMESLLRRLEAALSGKPENVTYLDDWRQARV